MLFIPVGTSGYSLDHLKKSYYELVSVCLETARYSYDDTWTFISRIDGHHGMFVNPRLEKCKAVEDFAAKSLDELIVSLEVEGFIQ